MILAIVGSTSLEGSAEAEQRIEWLLDEHRPDVVVSGGAPGIDTMAATAARRRGITVWELTPAKRAWNPIGRTGFKRRNIAVALVCDRLARIYDPETETYGSGWTRDYAEHELHKPTEEHAVKANATQRATLHATQHRT